MFGVRKAPTGCNFVHNDEIWKDHVHRELQTSRKWPDTWGFLASHYETQKNKGSKDVKLPPIPVKEEHKPENIRNLVATKDQAVGMKRPVHPKRTKKATEPVGKTTTQKMTYPRTTAAQVGWICDRKLEVFGRHARGQTGIRKLLNWPREAVF